MRRLIIALISLAMIGAHAQLRKLSDVFEVDTRDPDQYPSSCLRLLDPNNPNSAIFDPNADERDTRHALNKIWLQISQLNNGVINQITHEAYDDRFETRKLMDALFAISPRAQSGDTFTPQGVYEEKLEEVRLRYDNIRKAIKKVEPDSKKKPKL